MDELVAEIVRHERLYYVEDRPEITDAQYDALVRELMDLEAAHPELQREDSPTRRVGGAPVSELPSVRHEVPLLSLENAYSREELKAWADRVADRLGRLPELVTELKIDGLSIALVYEEGRLVRAATRGEATPPGRCRSRTGLGHSQSAGTPQPSTCSATPGRRSGH